MTWNAWEKIEKFHISETFRSSKHSAQQYSLDPEILDSGQGRDSPVSLPRPAECGRRVRSQEWPWQGSGTGHGSRGHIGSKYRDAHTVSPSPLERSWAPCPPGSPPPIVPAQVVSPDLLPRLAANTKPKQNSLIVKTNFYSLLMHAFSAFTSLTMLRPKEAHQLFCDHPCFHLNSFEHFSQTTYTEKNFHSRQKKPVKPLNKSQHRHYNSNGPFPFYHFSSSQKAHNWFLSTNSLFFRYVTSEL